MNFFDAHNHLQDERLGSAVSGLRAVAEVEHIGAMVVNGSSSGDWADVLELAARFPGLVLPSLGVHPWYVGEQPQGWQERLEHLVLEHRTAVGEIGLDRWKEDLLWAGQEEAFRWQLDLAARHDLPVSIHCLRAWGPLVDILESAALPPRGFLLHSFGGSLETAHRLLPLGAHFSFPGYFLGEDKLRKQEVFNRLPLERLLVETDAPDQPLPSVRRKYELPGNANHPGNLGVVYEGLSKVVGCEISVLAERLEQNFRAFFGPVWPPGQDR